MSPQGYPSELLTVAAHARMVGHETALLCRARAQPPRVTGLAPPSACTGGRMLARFLTHFRQQYAGFLAVFIVLGGASYAVATNSVGSAQIKNSSIRSKDIRDHELTSNDVRSGSLLAADFKPGQLPPDPRGPEGARGATGPAGATGPQGPTGDPARRETRSAGARRATRGPLDLWARPVSKASRATLASQDRRGRPVGRGLRRSRGQPVRRARPASAACSASARRPPSTT